MLRAQQLKDELAGLCAASTSIKMAVAFWGDGAGEALGLLEDPSKACIVCNLRMGGTNPREIKKLRDRKVRIKHSDILHAKLYLFDDCAIIGSSNASANGLSLQGGESGGWLEANVHFNTKDLLDEAQTYFKEIWDSANEVSDQDLAEAQAAWNRRRKAGANHTGSQADSILDALKSQPSIMADRDVYITIDFFDMSAAAKKVVAQVQEESGLGETTDAWEAWPDMPNGAEFVCFSSEKTGIDFGGLWRSPPYRRETKVRGSTMVHFVDKSPSICGIKKLGPISEWRKIISKVIERRGADRLICIEAGEFAREFL